VLRLGKPAGSNLRHVQEDRLTIWKLLWLTAGVGVGLTCFCEPFKDFQWNDTDDWRILGNGILSGLSLSALLFGLNLRLRGRRLGFGALFGVMSGLGAILLLPPLLVVDEGKALGNGLAFACIVYMMPLMALWFLLAAAVGGRLRRKIWSRPMPWTEKFGYLLAMAWSPLGVWMLVDIYRDALMK